MDDDLAEIDAAPSDQIVQELEELIEEIEDHLDLPHSCDDQQ